MTREEAIKEIKSWDFLEGKEIEAIQTIIPELKENDDERIRKELIEFIQWSVDRRFMREDFHQAKRPSEWIAWLEKQKENSKSADSIPSDCTSDAKCEDRWHKVSDSLPDNPREVLCKDEAGNYFIGRYYTGEGWEISNYDDEDKPHHLNPPVSKWIDFPSEKQKEQKPVSISCGHENDAEWGQEDKEKIVTISEIIEHCTTIPYSGGTLTLNKEYKKELLCFIRTLRPSWKPSIEDLKKL